MYLLLTPRLPACPPWQIVQYIELFKAVDTDDCGDGDRSSSRSASESFTYASEYLNDAYDNDGQYYASSYYYYSYPSSYSDIWSEESTCAEVLENPTSYFSSSMGNTSNSSTSYSPSSSTPLPSSSSVSFTGGFHKDTVGGHGTWCAGIAAGAISPRSNITEEDCQGDEVPGCVGGCVMASEVDELLSDPYFDLDLFCPMYQCDGDVNMSCAQCLSDDPIENLHQNNGIAPGAQISVFDVMYGETDVFAHLGGNLVWESAMGTGAKIHSNSWGAFTSCELTETEFLYDTFMYEVGQ